jgi:GAF domain-containing protein
LVLNVLDTLVWRRRLRAAIRVLVIILAAAALWAFSVLVQEKLYLQALAVAAAIAALSMFELFLADFLLDTTLPRSSRKFLERLQLKLVSTSMKEEILTALRACVESFEGCDVGRVSSTVHLAVPVSDPRDDGLSLRLFQLFEYTRPGLGGHRWRLTDPAKGIVGRCLRLQRKVWVNFPTATEYYDRMVEEFGFTPEEASRHTTTARSYLAMPLVDEGRTIGVLYFFSTEPQTFPIAADDGRLREAAATITGLLRVAEVI